MHAFIASTETTLIRLSFCQYLTADMFEIFNGITKGTQESKGEGIYYSVNIKLTPSTFVEVAYAYIKGMKIFQNSRSHLKIIGTRRGIRSKFHT